MRTQSSIGGLITELKEHTKTLLRDEARLAKTELTEKASHIGKKATFIAIGGFVAYAGLVILLGGVGVLIAYFIERAGMNPALATFIGLGIAGLAIIAAGCGLLFASLKAIKEQPLTPKRTIDTLQHLRGAPPLPLIPPAKKVSVVKPSTTELQTAVMETEGNLADTFQELTDRVTLKDFRDKADRDIHDHPYRWGALAIGLGLIGGYLVERNLMRHELH